MSKLNKFAAITFGDTIKSRLSDSVLKAIESGDEDLVIASIVAPCNEFMVHTSLADGTSTQVDAENVYKYTKHVAPLYAGLDQAGNLHPNVDHITACKAVATHYNYHVDIETQHIGADAGSIYLTRDIGSGLYIQRAVNLANTIAYDVVRNTSSLCLQANNGSTVAELTKDSNGMINKYFLLKRQLEQALAAVNSATESVEKTLQELTRHGSN